MMKFVNGSKEPITLQVRTKNSNALALIILSFGLFFNFVLLFMLEDRYFNTHDLTRTGTTVILTTFVNSLIVLLICGAIRVVRKKWPAFIIPAVIVTMMTTSIFLLASYDKAEAAEVATPNLVTYQLTHVWKKKIKAGNVTEEKLEPQTFFGKLAHYRIEGIDSRRPILKKFADNELVEKKSLTVLNITSQGNIYLADVSAAGNIFLISIFPKQKTVAVSMQYWGSHEDVVILWQGFGLYK